MFLLFKFKCVTFTCPGVYVAHIFLAIVLDEGNNTLKYSKMAKCI